jgi:hypothetical protein
VVLRAEHDEHPTFDTQRGQNCFGSLGVGFVERPRIDDGDPSLWFTQGATKLVLHPPPDSVFADSYVSGWYLHPTVSDEDDVLEIPDADIEAAAIECALAIMRPRAAGSAKEHLESLKQELAGMKEEIRRRSFNTDSPAVLVRPKRSVYSL